MLEAANDEDDIKDEIREVLDGSIGCTKKNL